MRRLLTILLMAAVVIALGAWAYQRRYPEGRIVSEDWDVIVVGSEPEGVMAAIASARQGAKTLLVSEDPVLGRTMTLAKLNSLDMNFNERHELLTKGLFEEWWNKINQALSFKIDDAVKAFEEMAKAEPQLTTRLQTSLIRIEQKPEQGITGIVFRDQRSGQAYRARAQRFIDATGDADLAAMAGVSYTVGRQDIGQPGVTMAPTLVFEVQGVAWPEVVRYVKGLKDPRYGVTEDSAWAYWEIAARYRPHDPQTYLRGLNLGRQGPDRVLVNALLIFNTDVLNKQSRQNALSRGTTEAQYIVDFLRKEAPGFENATLAGVAPQLYVRESRYIQGIYQLTLEDVTQERHHWDEIAIGSYPIDIQAVSINEKEKTLYVPKEGYGIPFRCLIPNEGPSNLAVIGRSASYGSQPAGSARVIPVGMVEGQAAGIAAVYSIQHQLDFRQLAANHQAIREVQTMLVQRGAYLKPAVE